MGDRKPRMPAIKCPSCGDNAFARSGGKSSLTYRELYYHCRNETGCGHVFVVVMEADRTVRPSMHPAPLTTLPMTTWRSGVPANDDEPSPANDDVPDKPGAERLT